MYKMQLFITYKLQNFEVKYSYKICGIWKEQGWQLENRKRDISCIKSEIMW